MTTPNPVKFVKQPTTDPPMGEYKPTAIDARKAAAQVLLVQVAPKIVNAKVELRGQGIKPFGPDGTYQVTDKAWAKIQATYTWQTDF